MADKMMRNAGRGPDGKAKAIRTDSEGNLTTKPLLSSEQLEVTMTDFEGKVRNDLLVPHTAYEGDFDLVFDGNNLMSPTPFEAGWTEFSQSKYNLLTTTRFAPSYYTNESGKYACHLFRFNLYEELRNKGKIPAYWKIEDVRQKIEHYNILWSGWGTGGGVAGARLHFWLRDRDNYSVTTRTHYQTSRTDINYSSTLLGSISPDGYYIDDDGFVNVLIRTLHPSDGVEEARIYTHHIEINDIRFKSELLMTDTSRAFDDKERAIRVVLNNPSQLAYDEMQDRLKVSVEESTTRKLLEEYIRFERQGAVVETLFDGELEPDETISDLYSLYRGEKETRILVSTDKEGRMIVGAGPFDDVENIYNGTTYPNTFNINDVFTKDKPLHVLPIYRGSIEVDENTTWEQAYQHRQLNDFRILFRNTASEKANVTIKIMRIFK